MGSRTAGMSTSKEAGDQILGRMIRELVDKNGALRRKVLELKRKEMNLRDRVIRNVRRTLEETPGSPLSPTREAATQTGASPASGSVSGAPAPGPGPATAPTLIEILPELRPGCGA